MRNRIVAPPLVHEEERIKEFGKLVATRTFDWPDGTQKEFLVWGGMKIPTIIFPVTVDGEVIATRQFRWGANEVILEVPGGNPKADENFEEVLRTELMEETGYEVGEIIRLVIPPLWFEPATCTNPYHAVLAKSCRRVADPKPDPGELLEVVTFPVEEWIDMIRRGRIVDSKSIVLTFLALPWLGFHLTGPHSQLF